MARRLVPGDNVGSFVVEQRLGAGGMGEVWRARDDALHRVVALKVLVDEDATLRARFVREGRAAAALAHPFVVTVFGAGEANGVAFLAMELVQGTTLRQAGRTASIRQKLAWLRDLAGALAAVHRAGFIHRDVKPDNVMITESGAVKLLDFGIARGAVTETSMTASGHVVGTPRYLAPEQWFGASADYRVDQFAWGLLAFELLSGRHPDDVSVGFGRLANWSAPARPLHTAAPELPFGVSAVVDRALARRPEERFATMEELAAQLGAIAAGPAEGASPYVPARDTQVTPLTGRPPFTPPAAPPPARGGALVFLGGILVVLFTALVGVAIAVVLRGELASTPAPAAVPGAVATPAAPAAPTALASAPASVEPGPSAAVSSPPPARPSRPAARPASAPSAPPSARPPPPVGACVAFRRLDVDTSEFKGRVPEPSRLAWESSLQEPLAACYRGTSEPMCVEDSSAIRVTIRKAQPRLQVGPVGHTVQLTGKGPDIPCLLAAIRPSLPVSEQDPVAGWLRVTLEP